MENTDSERKGNRSMLSLAAIAALVVLSIWISPFMLYVTGAQTYNATAILNTTVNITNAAPLVHTVLLQDPINLVGYGNASVLCNASVEDFDNDSLTVTATLYQLAEATAGDPDDGNNHYTNNSCTRYGAQDINTTWLCGFQMRFYANAASDWICNVSVDDGVVAVLSTNISEPATVNPLIAVVVPGVLDFGELVTGEISTDKLGNVTNGGNREINISINAWGSVEGDGIAMDCDYNSISYSDMRYDIESGTAFGSMTAISGVSTLVNNLEIDRRFSEEDDLLSTNTTYWKLRIPLGAGGVCNGKILFTGSDANA